jgi:RNA recognition motif-containing protein
MNIFVGNLSFETTDDDLRAEFSAFGELTSVTVLKDKFTNKSRGFGFVEMANKDEATKAIEALNGKNINGRTINVAEARPKEERSSTGGNRNRPNNNYNRNRSW